MIIRIQLFGGLLPQNLGGQKSPKFGVISDGFRLWSPISPKRIKISKIGKASDQPQQLARSGIKIFVNFGQLTKKL